MRKEVENWIKQAEADLKTSRDCLNSKNYYAGAFFAEQCAEKALKAYFVFSKNDTAPKTHNLFELAMAVSLPKELIPIARKLTPDFIVSRYPDAAGGIPAELYDEESGKDALKRAEAIFVWIKNKLEK
ncbi:HEPN domain protein [uncultured archaeon]|nr:HEPN domain protein [uncultured archaeon]